MFEESLEDCSKNLSYCLKSIWELMVHIWQCSTSKLLDQLFNGKHFWKFEYLRKKLPKYNFFFNWLAINYLMAQHWSYILKWFSHASGFTPIEQISWNPTHFWAVSSTKMSVCVYTPCRPKYPVFEDLLGKNLYPHQMHKV